MLTNRLDILRRGFGNQGERTSRRRVNAPSENRPQAVDFNHACHTIRLDVLSPSQKDPYSPIVELDYRGLRAPRHLVMELL